MAKEFPGSGEHLEKAGTEGPFERMRAAEAARQALLTRRRVSLRFQIYLGFFLVFLFSVAVATALVLSMLAMEEKLQFLEIVDESVTEIQQARRFEKNYFLYGTNLSDALENVYQAKGILDHNGEELTRLFGKTNLNIMQQDMARYEGLLEQLADLERGQKDSPATEARKREIEVDLRKYGQQLLVFAQDLVRKEKISLSGTVRMSRNIHIYSMALLLVFVSSYAYLLRSRILSTINRFRVYAQRIASGDFTPITPMRRFGDEFTDLALAINQMIVELERREAVLIQSHKMRAVGTLTAGVAHELNNPLNNISLSAHMLLEDYETLSHGERKEMIVDVVNEADRSKKIISNLLDFARESGSQLEPLDLARLLRDTIDLAANQIKLAGIKIEFHVTDNLPRIHGDDQQLRQVFLNLLLNAIDASGKGGKIQVLALPADEPHYVAVKIIDFGKGIPEHILGSIFDPFFTTKAKGKGTGLGLSVSQGIVVKHGGRIRVSSREGEGSTFTVTLPVTTIPSLIPSEKKALSEV
jgi:two-component system NtrC family sensor kinase